MLLSQVRRLIVAPSDDAALLKAQHQALSQQLPLMYIILLINSWALAATHIGIAPLALTTGVPTLFTLVIAVRIVYWWRARHNVLSSQQLRTALFSVNFIGGALAVVLSAWSFALFAYGDAYTKSHVAFYMAISVIAVIFSLMHLLSAAFIVAACVNVSFFAFFSLTGQPTFMAIAINTLLVSVCLLAVLVVNYRNFERMVLGQEHAAILNVHNLRLTNLDTLTDLPNRRAFFETLKDAFECARVEGNSIAVGIIDIDGFKSVNDMYGHAVADMLLVEAAGRLAELGIARRFTVARIGGNQFAIILVDTLNDAASAQGEEICALLRAPFVLSGVTIGVSASVGMAIFPNVASSHEQLFDRSDYALLQEKRTRRGGCTIFSSSHDAQIDRDVRIEQALKLADLEKELRVVFQPIIDARSGTTIGFEALARWESKILGDVPPCEFIPIAERAGLVRRLTRPLLKSALEIALGWSGGTRLSFNLSAHDLISPGSVLGLVSIIEKSGFDPRLLDLEITETALAHDFEQIRQSVDLLRGIGCGISLDDFGTGYSSLARLHALPLTKIKIDRGFVTDIHLRPASYKIVKSLLTLSRDMGLDCVIEGVETSDELATVTRLGGFLVQGYYFSRPLAAAATDEFLRRSVRGCNLQADRPSLLGSLGTNPGTGARSLQSAGDPYSGLSAGAMDFIRQFDPATLDPLLEGLAASDLATAIFDPEDRLVFSSPAFCDLYDVQGGEQTFSSVMRHCHETNRGPHIDTTDIDTWLTIANKKRRTVKHRKFEVDLVDGRWLWALETTYGAGWVLLAFMELTAFKLKETDLRIARDAAVLIAETDHLTGLTSRRGILRYLDDCVKAARLEAPLTVALLDIDQFKQINDSLGHDVGDRVLRRFGHHSSRMFHNSAKIGRLGGEEFLLVMPDTNIASAFKTLQRFRRHWQRASGNDPDAASCTFSAGLSGWSSGLAGTELYREADRALYKAKSSGRDRVVISQSTASADLDSSGLSALA